MGKFALMFNHRLSSSRVLGTEFIYHHLSQSTKARFGLTHQFEEGTNGKVKIDQEGNVNGVLKHKVSDSTTMSLTSGINLK
jgi:hypothetical protein